MNNTEQKLAFLRKRLIGCKVELDDRDEDETVSNVTEFEPEDRSVGIFGNYIEISTVEGSKFAVDDEGLVYPFNVEGDDVMWRMPIGVLEISPWSEPPEEY